MSQISSSQSSSQPRDIAPESGFIKRMRDSLEKKLHTMDEKTTGDAIRRSGESIKEYQKKHNEERVPIADKHSLPPPHSKKVANEYGKLLGQMDESGDVSTSELKGRVQTTRPNTLSAPAA